LRKQTADEVYVFQLDLDVLLDALEQDEMLTQFHYSTYPATDRDIAFSPRDQISVAEFEKGLHTQQAKSNRWNCLMNIAV